MQQMHTDLFTHGSSRAPRACLDVGTSCADRLADDPWPHDARARHHTLQVERHLLKRGVRSHKFDSFKGAVGAVVGSESLVLLMPVWIMDELPVQLLCLFGIELLSAFWALEGARHFDAHIGRSPIARLGGIANLHRLRHDACKSL